MIVSGGEGDLIRLEDQTEWWRQGQKTVELLSKNHCTVRQNCQGPTV